MSSSVNSKHPAAHGKDSSLLNAGMDASMMLNTILSSDGSSSDSLLLAQANHAAGCSPPQLNWKSVWDYFYQAVESKIREQLKDVAGSGSPAEHSVNSENGEWSLAARAG